MQKQVSDTPAASNSAGATETAAAVPSAREAPAQARPAVTRPLCSRPATAASIVPSNAGSATPAANWAAISPKTLHGARIQPPAKTAPRAGQSTGRRHSTLLEQRRQPGREQRAGEEGERRAGDRVPSVQLCRQADGEEDRRAGRQHDGEAACDRAGMPGHAPQPYGLERALDVRSADHLLRNADLAIYRAKANGAGGFERDHPRLHVALVERLQLEAELRQALAAGELELHYQPTLALATGGITGVEALARWKHPRRGFVSPAEFIPLAEQTGLIRKLGRFGLQEACRQLVEWTEAYPGNEHLTMSVNISGRHLQEASLIDDVQEALAASGLEPARLVLEMTESVLMDHTEENVELLGRLKELGVGLAIDDFGTGYSSLAYLHRFPADVIKIDRSFVERLGGSDSDMELLRTIVQLGQSLRMVTVAEGVETAEQAESLREMGCELAQGFHFHRPLTSESLRQVLAGKPAESGRRAA